MPTILDCLNPGWNRIEHVLENAKAKGIADDRKVVRKMLLTACSEGDVTIAATKEPGVFGYKRNVKDGESDADWLPPVPASP